MRKGDLVKVIYVSGADKRLGIKKGDKFLVRDIDYSDMGIIVDVWCDVPSGSKVLIYPFAPQQLICYGRDDGK